MELWLKIYGEHELTEVNLLKYFMPSYCVRHLFYFNNDDKYTVVG